MNSHCARLSVAAGLSLAWVLTGTPVLAVEGMALDDATAGEETVVAPVLADEIVPEATVDVSSEELAAVEGAPQENDEVVTASEQEAESLPDSDLRETEGSALSEEPVAVEDADVLAEPTGDTQDVLECAPEDEEPPVSLDAIAEVPGNDELDGTVKVDDTLSHLGPAVPEGVSWQGAADLGWQLMGDGWHYYSADGSMVRGEAYLPQDNGSGSPMHWYHFDESTGVASYGWKWLSTGSKWVYYDNVFAYMLYGEQLLHADNSGSGDEHWYYFDDVTGATTYGWKWLDAGQKWVCYEGTPQTGGMGWMLHGEGYVRQDNNAGSPSHWYYFDDMTGATTYGFKWVPSGSKWCYYDTAYGYMLYGEQNINNSWYYLNPTTGAVTYGLTWLPSGSKWVFYDTTTGTMYHGWNSLGGVSLHFDEVTGALTAGTGAISTINMRMSIDEYARILGTDASSVALQFDRFPLQFANLADVDADGVTAAMIDEYIAANCTYAEQKYDTTSALRGMGQTFIDAAKTYGVNLQYLIAHAVLESAWGCSALANGSTGYHNFFGIGAYDANALLYGSEFSAGQGWKSSRDALMGGTQWIANHYIRSGRQTYGSQTTLYEMRWDPAYTAQEKSSSWHLYATAGSWATGIASVMQSAYTSFKKTVLTGFDLPLFS